MSIFTSDEQLINHFVMAARAADAEISNLNDRSMIASGILNCFGMSGKKTRHLLNNLANFQGLKYAEVGTYMGSTLFSALYRNNANAVICDNWSEFGGPKAQFVTNLEMYVAATRNFYHQKIVVYDRDFNSLVGDDSWSEIDFYNFDGPHDEESQYQGIVKIYPFLSERFLLFVDDWFWSSPRDGTRRALEDLKIQVLANLEVQVEEENGRNRFEKSDWHNGIAIYACKKTT